MSTRTEYSTESATIPPGQATASAYALGMDSDTGQTALDSPFRDVTILP